MLEKNKHILNQITTLSTLMVNLSSCIKFDRYRGYDSVDELNEEASQLAKNRNLYASEWFFTSMRPLQSSVIPEVNKGGVCFPPSADYNYISLCCLDKIFPHPTVFQTIPREALSLSVFHIWLSLVFYCPLIIDLLYVFGKIPIKPYCRKPRLLINARVNSSHRAT